MGLWTSKRNLTQEGVRVLKQVLVASCTPYVSATVSRLIGGVQLEEMRKCPASLRLLLILAKHKY